MRQCMDAENLHRRLKKIIGQVQAIDRMVDEDVACEDILSQINAAKSALHKAGQVIVSETESNMVTRIKRSKISPKQWNGLQTYKLERGSGSHQGCRSLFP